MPQVGCEKCPNSFGLPYCRKIMIEEHLGPPEIFGSKKFGHFDPNSIAKLARNPVFK